MADYSINITGYVPDILKYENGKVFCNDGNGCEAYDVDTGDVLNTWTTTVAWEDWTPPPGVTNIGIRLRTI